MSDDVMMTSLYLNARMSLHERPPLGMSAGGWSSGCGFSSAGLSGGTGEGGDSSVMVDIVPPPIGHLTRGNSYHCHMIIT